MYFMCAYIYIYMGGGLTSLSSGLYTVYTQYIYIYEVSNPFSRWYLQGPMAWGSRSFKGALPVFEDLEKQARICAAW